MEKQERTLGLIEIKPEFAEEWRRWGAQLTDERNTEAIETLVEEGLSQEHVFLIELDSRYFLGFFTEGEHRAANMERGINQAHRKLLEASTVRKVAGEELYSLEA